MKKLKIKVFFTIFIILSLFSLTLIMLINVREYSSERHSIESILNRNIKKNNYFNDLSMMTTLPDFDKQREIFIDYEVYNVIFDEETNKAEVILTASTDDEKVLKDIEKKAIFYKGKGNDTTYFNANEN